MGKGTAYQGFSVVRLRWPIDHLFRCDTQRTTWTSQYLIDNRSGRRCVNLDPRFFIWLEDLRQALLACFTVNAKLWSPLNCDLAVGVGSSRCIHDVNPQIQLRNCSSNQKCSPDGVT